jgi:hypothetical protein
MFAACCWLCWLSPISMESMRERVNMRFTVVCVCRQVDH